MQEGVLPITPGFPDHPCNFVPPNNDSCNDVATFQTESAPEAQVRGREWIESVQGQVGQGLEQRDLVEGVPPHGRRVGMR